MDAISESKFCERCGGSLTPLLGIHQSRTCSEKNCDKTIYFLNLDEGRGLKVEAGEKLHFPLGSIRMSLDPNDGNLTEAGLKFILTSMFVNGFTPGNDKSFLAFAEEQEKALDSEISQLEWVNHLDLSKPDDCEQIAGILQNESLRYYHLFFKSSAFGEAHRSFKAGNFEQAAQASYMAHVYHTLSALENEHLTKIVSLGYSCYSDLVKNNNSFGVSAKEKILLDNLTSQLMNLDDPTLHIFLTDGKAVSNRLGIKGLDEATIKSAMVFEQKRREGSAKAAAESREHNLKYLDLKSKVILSVIGLILTLFGILIGKS